MVAITIDDQASGALRDIGTSLEQQLRESALIGEAANVLLDAVKASVRQTFRNQTGALENSFSVRFIRSADGENVAAVVSDSPYAVIQDEGGTILPRRGRHLAIPIPGAGVPRGKWPRDFARGELTFITSRRGNKLLARVSRNGIKPMFVLKERVTLKGTDYLKRAAVAAAAPVADVIERGVTLAIERAV